MKTKAIVLLILMLPMLTLSACAPSDLAPVELDQIHFDKALREEKCEHKQPSWCTLLEV